MDHLPLPLSTPWKHINVPLYTYAEGQRYTFSSPWHTYDVRHDYHPDSKLHIASYDSNEDAYPESVKPQMAAFVQAWLWFGVLFEFLHFPPDSCGWIEEAAETEQASNFEHRVTTKRLLPLLDSWCRNVRLGTADVRSTILRSTDRLLFAASQRFGAICFSWTGVTTQKPNKILPQPLMLSIQLLLSTLRIARNIAFADETSFPDTGLLHYDLLLERMKDDGWCPSEIWRVQTDARQISQYCVSFLGSVRNQLNHSNCTTDRCDASQIEHATYQARHTAPRCGCAMTVHAGVEVAQILRSGQIPILRLAAETITLTSVSLQNSENEAFIAISHVWSDGLGNLQQNSLPLCQVHKIQRQVNDLVVHYGFQTTTRNNVNFWIDTICVPVGADLELERNLAIARMKEVYQNAHAVLILNFDLENIPSDRDSWELSARINRTSWFRRLWTLHEGVLSRRSFFQLQDRAVEMDDLASRLPCEKDSVSAEIHGILFSELSNPYTAMNEFKKLPPLLRSREIWTAVHSRSTSNLEDETICLANMLGLNLAPILSVNRYDHDACDKRMQAFILQQRLFPQASPFYTRRSDASVSTLTSPGFGWAPKSFVFRAANISVGATSPLVPASSRGLHVQLPGVLTGGDWPEFLKKIQETGEKLKELIDPRFVIESREVKFMIPFRWDEYYILSLDRRLEWRLTDDIRRSTYPAIIFEKDLVNEEIDTRQLSIDGKRLRAFPDDCPRSFDVDETFVGVGWCGALLVAVPKPMCHSLSSPEWDATIVASAIINKHLFDGSSRPIWSQVFFSSQKDAVRDLGYFEGLPTATKWCIG